jgi:tetratricopeptide (TPR) repeat protein
MRFQAALDAYEQAASRDPTAPFAPVSRARAAELRSHSEGAFVPLVRLEEVRRDPAKNRDPQAIRALDRDARGFPDGPVRGEAMLVVAQAYEHALGAPDEAIAALEAALGDPRSERSTRALALSEVVTLYRTKGDLRGALAAVTREPDLLPSLTREVRGEVRRGRIGIACLVALACLAAFALWGGARAARRLGDVRALGPLVLRPAALAFAFYVGAGGAIFVRLSGGEGDPMPFLFLGIGVAVVSVLARMCAIGPARRTRRSAAASAIAGVLGTLAVAYLILWKSSGAYLSPLGL